MDYRIVSKTQKQHSLILINFLVLSLLPYGLCIINRDLVLTPKQGLQLSGKRIFYEESFGNEINTLNHNDSAATMEGTRPWERTLKHVTYLTLFTNAANGIITGNFSKVKEYNDFLTSTYVRSPKSTDSRFGDIVTLAQGRLEAMPNGSYRFVEGNCDYKCSQETNIVAMWHVQKIRHRETTDRKYHYEMKFSVSPMTAKAPTETVVRGGPNKRTIMEENRNNVQTFIQKEDDYPHSFSTIVTDKDEDFLERRYDATRNFRQVNPHYQTQQVTPIPQSTFLRGVYHHPPPPMQAASMQLHHNKPLQHSMHTHSQLQHKHHYQQQLPLPERLNIGEFYKGSYAPKSPSKIDLFPNLLNMFMGKPHSLTPPTTFRPPSHQIKLSRPEIYALQQQQIQEFPKFSDYQQPPLSQSQNQFSQRTPPPVSIVTHHYHHHYFMPNNSAIALEQAIQHSTEQSHDPPAEVYQNEVTEVAAPHGYIENFNQEPHITSLRQDHFPHIQHEVQTQYNPNIQQQDVNQNYHTSYHVQDLIPPAPQKFVFPNTQIERQQVIHVTPAPPLRKPQYMQHTQQQQHYDNRPFTSSLEYTTVHVPLLISYPAPIHEEKAADTPTPRYKPFVQSDPIEDSIQYSEPDPLYANANNADSDNEKKFLSNANHQQKAQLESPDNFSQRRNSQQQSTEEEDNKKEHTESVEAQLPAPNHNTDGTEDETSEDAKRNVIEETTSQSVSSSQILNEIPTTTKSIKTEASNSITAATKIPKLFAMRSKRISLIKGNTTSRPTTSTPSASPIPITIETPRSFTTNRTRKTFISTPATESPARTINRYRNSYSRTSSTSTTTTEKPVLKWSPKRKNINAKFMTTTSTTPANENEKEESDESDDSDESRDSHDNEDNDENEDFKTNESNNLMKAKSSMLPTTKDDFDLEATTEMSNDITTSVTTTTSKLSSAAESPSPLLSETSQTETDIYEVLTQKSVSKSVSLKVGNNGEEIPLIIDDGENEVKKF